jgi:hypothetical protein
VTIRKIAFQGDELCLQSDGVGYTSTQPGLTDDFKFASAVAVIKGGEQQQCRVYGKTRVTSASRTWIDETSEWGVALQCHTSGMSVATFRHAGGSTVVDTGVFRLGVIEPGHDVMADTVWSRPTYRMSATPQFVFPAADLPGDVQEVLSRWYAFDFLYRGTVPPTPKRS